MEFCGMKREIDRKCLIHARVHANAQSFDRCEASGQVKHRKAAIQGLLVIQHMLRAKSNDWLRMLGKLDLP